MHALEIGSAGQVAFATREVPAWHLLGTVFDKDESVTTTQMLEKAHLDGWNVRLIDAADSLTDARFVTDTLFVVRDNPFDNGLDVLSTVGGRYKVVQNEELFSFGDNLLDGGGQWETAGSIKSGRQVFGSLKIDRPMVLDALGRADEVDTYLLVNTSHDGTVGVQASTTPVRVVCQNTLNIALRGAKQTFKMRHTQTVDGRIAAAREALNLTHTYLDVFEAEAQKMIQTDVTNAQFQKIVEALYPKPEKDAKGAQTRWENKINLLGDLFAGVEAFDGAPITNANIKGTAWGALNALTERLDWYRSPRNGDGTALAESASGFNPVVNAEKQRIVKVVKTLVGV
jgi:phage/plasmid-like protein (TIGR03299 family)